MMSDIHDCIGAFADGEPVDPELLERALADPEGRAYLIDVLVLRGWYGHRGSGAELNRAGGEQDSGSVAAAGTLSAAGKTAHGRWLTAIAALITVSVLGGYIAGRQSVPRDADERAAAARQAKSDTSLTAPAPTQIIKLEPGVDWNERGGGD
jgi:hypothetical protein